MYNVYPTPTFVCNYDAQKNRTVNEQSGITPGMTVKQLMLCHVLGAMVTNPATMLDPEAHVDYAVKLVELAYRKLVA